ncbi:MAG: flagellin [FCB group bacterium]|nr:flagellin [FCB group bacterium]
MANGLFRVAANIQSLRALQSLVQVNARLAKHQYRLSTGKRINSAEDDSAGYALAKELQARTSGLKQALRNVGNAKNIIAIGEGGYEAQMEILQTIKDKVVQAADDSMDSGNRTAIGDTVNQMLKELDDIRDQTKWNGNSILSSGHNNFTFQVGAGAGASLAVSFDVSASNSVGSDGVDLSSISLASAASASAAMTSVDNAITSLSKSMQELGNYQMRLSSKENMLSVSIANTESIRSNIEDADFAEEQMEVLKLQILQQTALSMFTQANASAQAVLALFQ